MARPRIRLSILCEDKRTEHFVRKLAEHYGLTPLNPEVAPQGKGSAEAWVRKQYAKEVKALRAQTSRGERVALIAITDGDRYGVLSRKASLASALRDDGLPDRGPAEPIAILIPTWSIETWFLWLCGDNELNEQESYKDTAKWKRALPTPTTAVKAYVEGPRPGEAQTVPSLDDSRKEMARVRET